jgi:hypothetical protein
MKNDPKEPTPHERFIDLGKRVMAIPRAKVKDLDKQWQKSRKAKRKRS